MLQRNKQTGRNPLRYTNKPALRTALAAVALGMLSTVAVRAEDAAMANKLDPNVKELDDKVLAASAAVKVEDGKYKDKDGDPTFHIVNDGKKVDWFLYSGYRRYHAECHVCHGPDAMGSTYAPALKDSLKHLSYSEFMGILAGGKQDVNSSDQKVMPAFADNKNVMCYADDLYVYLRARAAGAWPRARPGEHEDKPDSAKTTEKDCLGG
ncbi:c-type cytochrome, methanol metabolism-related [Methylobacterium sp. C25]|nr:c-type cytochrome, methanol metabolism-related [Methylobacterium sp. C25]